MEGEFDVQRRTIQRDLRQLVEQQLVRKLGRGRSTMYAPLSTTGDEDGAARTEDAAESYVEDPESGPEFSAESERVRRRLEKPVNTCSPLGYRYAFLESYDPGTSSYLSASDREELAEIGALSTGELPAGTYARRILDRLLIDLSWNSSRLEGNTYSLLETERLLDAGLEATERDPFETQMILNHKAAIEFLVENAGEIDFDRRTILNLHALLSENLLADASAGGRIRRRHVGIGNSVFEPLADPHRLESYFDELLDKARAIDDPYEQAFFFLVQLPYLQPFIDVNKRVSRLGVNIPFVRDNLCPLSFVDVSAEQYAFAMLAIYEQNEVTILRDLFVWAYRRSAERYRAIRESMGEPDTFKLEHRRDIKELVARIIRGRMMPDEAMETVQRFAEAHPESSERWIQVIQEELESLHEGNFARYRVRPSEFQAWDDEWPDRPLS